MPNLSDWLSAVTARLKAATPGPWRFGTTTGKRDAMRVVFVPTETYPIHICRSARKNKADLTLISRAPADLAYALRVIEAAQEVATACARRLERWNRTTYEQAVDALTHWRQVTEGQVRR